MGMGLEAKRILAKDPQEGVDCVLVSTLGSLAPAPKGSCPATRDVYTHILQSQAFVVFLIYSRQPFLHQTKTICLASPRPQNPLGSRKGWVALWKWEPVSGWGQGVAESQALGQRKSSWGRRQNRLDITSAPILAPTATLDLGQGN